MSTPRRMQVVLGVMTWMVVVTLILATISALTLELLFVFGVIGLAIIRGVTGSITVVPYWRTRFNRIVTVSVVIFAGFVGYRIIQLLAIGI